MKDIPVYKNKKRHDQLLARYAGEAYFDCLYLEQKYSGYYHYKLFDQLLLACIYCPPITIDELLYWMIFLFYIRPYFTANADYKTIFNGN